MRAAVHTGEIEVAGDDIHGLAVHEAARILSLADSGDVLVSSTTVSLAGDSGIEFEDRGEFELRGVPGKHQLFAVAG